MTEERATVRPIDLVGRWSRDLGFQEDFSSDVRLVFEHDGAGVIESASERIEFTWKLSDDSMLVLTTAGRDQGPQRVQVMTKNLPRGRYEVLLSDGALVPFGLRQFTRMAAT